MLQLLPIASGSTGNCMLVDLDGQRILIDLGVTAKALSAALNTNGYGWDDIDAVLITHSHSDHVKGLDVCMKRIAAPVYTSGTTRDTLMLDRALILPYTEKVEIIPASRSPPSGRPTTVPVASVSSLSPPAAVWGISPTSVSSRRVRWFFSSAATVS